MNKRIIWMILFLFVFTAIAKEKSDFSEPLRVISAWLDAQKDYKNIPGLSAGIVIDQDLIWSVGFGYSDLSLKNDAECYS